MRSTIAIKAEKHEVPQKVQIDIESAKSEFERSKDSRSKEERKDKEGDPRSENVELISETSVEE